MSDKGQEEYSSLTPRSDTLAAGLVALCARPCVRISKEPVDDRNLEADRRVRVCAVSEDDKAFDAGRTVCEGVDGSATVVLTTVELVEATGDNVGDGRSGRAEERGATLDIDDDHDAFAVILAGTSGSALTGLREDVTKGLTIA